MVLLGCRGSANSSGERRSRAAFFEDACLRALPAATRVCRTNGVGTFARLSSPHDEPCLDAGAIRQMSGMLRTSAFGLFPLPAALISARRFATSDRRPFEKLRG